NQTNHNALTCSFMTNPYVMGCPLFPRYPRLVPVSSSMCSQWEHASIGLAAAARSPNRSNLVWPHRLRIDRWPKAFAPRHDEVQVLMGEANVWANAGMRHAV